MSLPAWGVYRQDKLVASVRAKDARDAREIFERHGIPRAGDKLRRVTS